MSVPEPGSETERVGSGMNDDGVVERGSGTVAECVNRIGFPRGDLSGWFPRHAGKPASQSAKSNELIIPANAECVGDTCAR